MGRLDMRPDFSRILKQAARKGGFGDTVKP